MTLQNGEAMKKYTAKEASVLMCMDVQMVRHFIKTGKLKAEKTESGIEIKKHDIYLFLKHSYFESAIRKLARLEKEA